MKATLLLHDADVRTLPGKVRPQLARLDDLDEVKANCELYQLLPVGFISAPHAPAVILVGVVKTVALVTTERPGQLVHEVSDYLAISFDCKKVEEHKPSTGNSRNAHIGVPVFASWHHAIFEDFVDRFGFQLRKGVHRTFLTDQNTSCLRSDVIIPLTMRRRQ